VGPPGCFADLINKRAPAGGPATRCSARPRAAAIITTAHRHQCRHQSPNLRQPPAETTSGTSISCLPDSPEQAAGLDPQGGGDASGALWPRSNSPRLQWLVPDGARWFVVPAHSTSSCSKLPQPRPHRAGWSASVLAFCPGRHGDAGGKRLREGGINGECGGTVETIDCRCQRTDGALSLGESGAATAARLTLWLACETRQPGACLRLHESTRSQGKEYPGLSSPCSPSTTPCCQRQCWCTPASPRQAAGLVLVGQKKKHWRIGGKNHLAAGVYTKLGGSGLQLISCQGRRAILALLSLRSLQSL